jgi:putative copper resistance protein D
VFLVCLARPLAWQLGEADEAVLRDAVRLPIWGALALVVAEAGRIALDGAVLSTTLGLGLVSVLTADFALAGLAKIAASLLLALLLAVFGARVPRVILLVLAGVVLAAATATTHAAARLVDREILLAATVLHLLGAAIWIGGIPSFIAALARVQERAGWRVVGERFSRISMIGVACIVVSAAVMSWYYIGDLQGFYGTAYGVMVGAKIAMFLALLGLGFGNFLTVRRMARDRTAPAGRLRRFAEAEIGIGFSLFFAAASLTSVPPAIDLTQDRVTLAEIAERNTPLMPRLVSPDHDSLTLPALQAKLDAEAAAQAARPAQAFIPGSGEIAARNAEDIAWSEYNHHWSGLFVLAIGLLALLHQAGFGPAKHWPLVFLGLAAFLFVRSDPEVWPLGSIGFFESLRDVEVLQHRFFVLLIVVFGLFEWRVRAGGWQNQRAALVFPLVTAIGGAALLTHSHAIANVKEQLLVELSHTPLALAGIAAGWARWLELRLDPPESRIAGWVWPACFVLVAAILLLYREA